MINLGACVVFLIQKRKKDENPEEAIASVASMVVTALRMMRANHNLRHSLDSSSVFFP
jgi:hypothetical protein